MKSSKNLWLVGLLAILVAVGLVAATVLIQQTQPGVPIGGSMTAFCPNTFATPVNVTLGSVGQVTFSCNSSTPTTSPAFSTGGPVVVTPTVTYSGNNPAPYNTSGLYIYTSDGAVTTGNCGSRTGALKINPGTPMTVPFGVWNYCAKYDTVGLGGLPSFTVAWNL